MKRTLTWGSWIVISLVLAAYLAWPLWNDEADKSMYLIGKTSHGHYQIELACSACHRESFGGRESLQESCVGCHAEELKQAKDSHPKSKFTDPRNADRVAILDARYCITCHTEHREEQTGAMGLSLPEDYCIQCHRDVGEDRPTHTGLGFETCASAGCHNFHDNRALYEDFLVKHGHDPDHSVPAVVPRRDYGAWYRQRQQAPVVALTVAGADAPAAQQDAAMMESWLASAHASAGVNCMHCHAAAQQGGAGDTGWNARPDHKICRDCHAPEVDHYLAGRHGMRLKAELGPMTPAQARIPMHEDAAHKSLGCSSCHETHRYDTRKAAVEACLGCHADEHTRRYEQSPHYRLWQAELAGTAAPGSGVSCASCHMPRLEKTGALGRILVEHNQNANLRPNEKMIRGVCMHCHGLPFAIDAMADAGLVRENFRGKASVHIRSVDWALSRVTKKDSHTTEENP